MNEDQVLKAFKKEFGVRPVINPSEEDFINDYLEIQQLIWDAKFTGYRAAIAKSVPNGWKLVPIEPTDDMILQGGYVDASPDWMLKSIYKEMLAAAPQPPVEED